MPDRILILAGTQDAVAYAERLKESRPAAHLILSLAGRLRSLPSVPGDLRIGGFGGVEGLIAYLRAEGITRVVDATHPFAIQISDHAAQACAALGLPLLVLGRPEWRKHPGDRWHWAEDVEMAARMAASLGRRVLLTVGAGSLAPFARRGGPHYVIRLIERPARRLLFRSYEIMLGRGPFTLEGEIALMRRHAIDLLVTKASGGQATEAKLAAARRLRIPVLMIRRPG